MLMRRLHAILAGSLILFGSLKGMAGLPCARHEQVAQSPNNPVAQHEHQVAQSPSRQVAQHDHSGSEQDAPRESCTCLDHCQSCLTTGLVAVAPALPEFTFLLSHHADALSASHVAPRAPYQLPYANGPPA
jgi:hypothetical protein